MNEVMSLDKAKMMEYDNKRLTQQQESMANNLREAFGYNPWLTAKQVNYKVSKMPVQAMYQDLADHVLRKDNQYQPLQRLLQEEKERVMVMEKGIDTAETTRFFIEKIGEYNSILDLDHIKPYKKNYNKLQKYVTTHPITTGEQTGQMKRYTGDHGQVTNFHFVLNWQNLMPVFRELSESRATTPKVRKSQPPPPVRKPQKKKQKDPKPKKSVYTQRMEQMFKEIEEKNQKEYKDLRLKDSKEEIEANLSLTEEVEDSDPNKAKLSNKSINTYKTPQYTPKQTISNLSQYQSNPQTPFNQVKKRKIAPKIHVHSDRSTNRPNTSTNMTKKLQGSVYNNSNNLQKKFDHLMDDQFSSEEQPSAEKQKMINAMIDTNFKDIQMAQFLITQEQDFQLPPKYLRGRAQIKDTMLRIKSEKNEEIDSMVNLNADKSISSPKSQVKVEKRQSPHSLPPLNNLDSQQKQRRRRKRVISELIARKQPKYIHVGGTKFAVLNTTDNLNIYAKMKQDGAMERLRLEQLKVRQQNEEDMMGTNLFILEGPPKKLKFESTDLRHDYHDMKVSKMMKQMNRGRK